MTRQRFDDRPSADHAVAAYYALLDAVRQHVWALITPGRIAGITASENGRPVEAAALRMAEQLLVAPDDVAPHPSLLRPPEHPWDEAARRLRAAADLLGTHTTINGGPRTPDAWVVWNDDARDGALGRLGALVVELAAAQDALALRAGQAGIHWSTVGRWLPPANRLREAALNVVAAADRAGARENPMDGLVPATGRVRVVCPVDEFGDRVARLRRRAWALRTAPDYSIRSWFDIAMAGLMVTAQTATFHGIDLHDAVVSAAHPSARRAASWLALMHDLRGYRGTGPGDEYIHADVTAVHDRWRHSCPATGPSSTGPPLRTSRSGTWPGCCMERALGWGRRPSGTRRPSRGWPAPARCSFASTSWTGTCCPGTLI